MKTRFMIVAVIVIPAILVCVSAFARDPIKWSAPMNQYPNAWSPTAPPPTYYNPYGYQYPYANYGYGNPNAYYGYGGNYGAGYYQGTYQQPQQSGNTGNPYSYYYRQ